MQKLVAAIEKFVPRSEIDERYLDSPYYLTPENKVGQDAFAVIREAMRRKGMVGLGKVVISRRERIVMLEPFEQGLWQRPCGMNTRGGRQTLTLKTFPR